MQTTFKTKGIFIEEKKWNLNKCRVKKYLLQLCLHMFCFFIILWAEGKSKQNKTSTFSCFVPYHSVKDNSF